jgi:hypothetical protein
VETAIGAAGSRTADPAAARVGSRARGGTHAPPKTPFDGGRLITVAVVSPAAFAARSSQSKPSTRTALRLCAAAFVAAVLSLGVTTYVGTAAGDDAIGHARTNAEPLAVAAEDVYRALSDADATAAAVFLSGSQAQTSSVQRYNADIQQVSAGLAAIGAQPGSSPQLREAVGRMQADLPEYTGVVGTAQADARQDLPVGAAYLREASGLMRSDLLPAAQRILTIQTDRLHADVSAGRGPRAALVVVWPALAVLGLAQLFMARRTHRVLNPSVAAGTLAVTLVAVWAAVAVVGATGSADSARGHRQSADALITTDLAVLRAHGDELLSLAARGEDVGSYEADFQMVGARLGTLLASQGQGPGIADARAGYQGWMTAHKALAGSTSSPQADNTANVQALAQVTGAQPGTGTLFARVDADLRGAITAEEAKYRATVEAAGSDLRGLATGTAALTAAALAFGAFGVNQRLREYR